jgi:hypothetical protein
MQMFQSMAIVKHLWIVENSVYKQIKYLFSKKKWSQDSLVIMMGMEGLEDPSSNLS